MARREVTRADLGRQLAVNATFKPVNIAAPAVVVVVGLLLGVPVIGLAVAVLLYAVLWVQTFFDSTEAEKVGKATYGDSRPRAAALDASRLDPEIARPLEQARRTAASIRTAVQQADQPMDDVVADVDALVTAMETSAKRAQLIADTLNEGQDLAALDRDIARRSTDLDPDVRALVEDLRAQRASIVRLQDKLERFQVGMERICASLGLLRTSVAEMSASEEEAAQRELSTQARELRERTQLLAQSMEETFAQ
jgi:chromosome segregation ATPase